MTVVIAELSSTQITVTIDGDTEIWNKTDVIISYSGSDILFSGFNADNNDRDYTWLYSDVTTPIATVGAQEVAYVIEKLCEPPSTPPTGDYALQSDLTDEIAARTAADSALSASKPSQRKIEALIALSI